MKTFLILAVLVAVASASKHQFHHHQEQDDEHHDDHHKHNKCKGEPIIRDEEFEKSMRECRKEIPRHEEEAEGDKSGRACRGVCALTKVGALDGKGFIVESKFKSMIHSAFVNQEARQEIESEVIACGRNATDLGIASSDDKCSNYKPFFKCTWFSIVEACADPAEQDEEME